MNHPVSHHYVARVIKSTFAMVTVLCLCANLTAQTQNSASDNLLLEGEKPLSQCVPFDMPDVQTLRQSQHQVFAHYFVPFPISIDNKPADKEMP